MARGHAHRVQSRSGEVFYDEGRRRDVGSLHAGREREMRAGKGGGEKEVLRVQGINVALTGAVGV
jgi:hypothetical protein